MTRFLVSIGAVALLTSAALAQTSTTTTTTTTGSLSSNSVTISPAEETKIKEYVTKEKRSVAAPSGFSLLVGADVPQSVELYSFPSDVGVTKYRYTVIGGKTALVDPSTRKVVRVIEQ